ncbi:hypothetical protein GCM10009754_73800 [Amycolatopsis minnesotensis]|uniref:Uncharacterized protein n=1 Tax=Amycolatopsis minnesotensis TaxID=337894 RepID=A0ABP5DS46_9PSEU
MARKPRRIRVYGPPRPDFDVYRLAEIAWMLAQHLAAKARDNDNRTRRIR